MEDVSIPPAFLLRLHLVKEPAEWTFKGSERPADLCLQRSAGRWWKHFPTKGAMFLSFSIRVNLLEQCGNLVPPAFVGIGCCFTPWVKNELKRNKKPLQGMWGRAGTCVGSEACDRCTVFGCYLSMIWSNIKINHNFSFLFFFYQLTSLNKKWKNKSEITCC